MIDTVGAIISKRTCAWCQYSVFPWWDNYIDKHEWVWPFITFSYKLGFWKWGQRWHRRFHARTEEDS